MRILSLLVLVWVIGIAINLWPQAESRWNTMPASELVASLVQDLPHAAAWPARAVDGIRQQV